MISEVYDALLSAGVEEQKARRAAEALANPKLNGDFGALRVEFTALRGEVSTLRWMVGTNIILTIAVLGRLLFIH
jgi:hypothetical protein